MKYSFWMTSYLAGVLSFSVLGATDDDTLRIKENECLSAASNQKVSEDDFQKLLESVENLCDTKERKEQFKEFKLIAEERFKSRPLRVVVLGFTCQDPSLAMSIQIDAMTTSLQKALDDSYEKVDRTGMAKAIEELQLQNSDLFNQTTTMKLGKFVGAKYDVQGKIMKNSSGEIVITVNCTETETRIIKKEAGVTLKEVGEIQDAIPNLAAQLSLKGKGKAKGTLSTYAIKWLNMANRELAAEKFSFASNSISRCNMFLGDEMGNKTLLKLQDTLTYAACASVERGYGISAREFEKQLPMAIDIFGDTDEVVIHYYYNMALCHLYAGNYEKASEACRDAIQRFRRTKEGKDSVHPALTELENFIEKKKANESTPVDKKVMDIRNNRILLENISLKLQPTPPADSPASVQTSASSPENKPAQKESDDKRSSAKLAPAVSTPPRTVSKSPVPALVQSKTAKPAFDNSELSALIQQANEFKSSWKWDKVLETVEKIRKIDPKNPIAQNLLLERTGYFRKVAGEAILRKQFSAAVAAYQTPGLILTPEDLCSYAECQKKTGRSDAAIRLYAEAAEQKNVEACLHLAKYYSKNNDVQNALKYFQSAAENGNSHACLSLALIYLSKQKGVYDEKKGIAFMKKAAEAGIPSAQYNLGCCYANFKGATYSCLPYDRQEAIKWLQKAKGNGVSVAERALRRLQ